jgi:hypothetical protein
MKEKESGDKPRQNLTTQDQKDQNGFDLPHEELVAAFKGFLQQVYKAYGRGETFKKHFPPENIIRSELYIQSRTSDKERLHFFYPLLHAWDALAFEHYDLADASQAADSLNCYSYAPYGGGIRSTVTLNNPIQVKMIDALTEVVGIPHQKGQTEITIPERLRGENYWQWRASAEYQQECDRRLKRAKVRQER